MFESTDILVMKEKLHLIERSQMMFATAASHEVGATS
jgi:hypothetical protein